MNASLAIQVLPMKNSNEEVLQIVDEVIEYIKQSGLNYEVGPFETTIEGDVDTLMDLAKEIQHVAAKAGAEQLGTYMKLFYNPKGSVWSIHEKVDKHRA